MMDEKDLYRFKRITSNIKLKDIAAYIGCSPTLLSKYEHGERGIKESKLIKYREFIDIKGNIK